MCAIETPQLRTCLCFGYASLPLSLPEKRSITLIYGQSPLSNEKPRGKRINAKNLERERERENTVGPPRGISVPMSDCCCHRSSNIFGYAFACAFHHRGVVCSRQQLGPPYSKHFSALSLSLSFSVPTLCTQQCVSQGHFSVPCTPHGTRERAEHVWPISP